MCPGRALRFPVNPLLTKKPQQQQQEEKELAAAVVMTFKEGGGYSSKYICGYFQVEKCESTFIFVTSFARGVFKGWWLKSLPEHQPMTYLC